MFTTSTHRVATVTSLALLILFISCKHSNAQTVAQAVKISGVINTYVQVTSAYANHIVVSSTAGFRAGRRALIMQMQGASFDSVDSNAFGAVTAYNGAGNYEFVDILSVLKDTVFLANNLQNNYDSSQSVQLITVPHYADAIVTAPLIAQPWNGATGGVLAFEVCGVLTLKSNISADAAGFRNGNGSAVGQGCGAGVYYCSPVSQIGAIKGEGIVQITDDQFAAGYGAIANGGGGGNKEECGGGGGANGGNGGKAANQDLSYSDPDNDGDPGDNSGDDGARTCSGGGMGAYSLLSALYFYNAKVFMGGGGGGGALDDHPNDTTFANGGNGGGIIIIRANTIIGNKNNIFARGASAGYFSPEGAGGGGAGGTIVLDVQNFATSLYIDASGGDGGNTADDDKECAGAGGGGGGGTLLISGDTLSPNVTVSINGGACGNYGGLGKASCGGQKPAIAGDPGSVIPKYRIPGSFHLDSLITPPNISIDGPVTFCSGDTIRTILQADSGYQFYEWSTGDTMRSITISKPGTYRVSVTGTTFNECASGISASVTISQYPPANKPQISGALVFCSGDSTVLTGTTEYATHLWSNGDTSTSITVHDAGTYSFTVWDSNGCKATAYTTVRTLPAPTPEITAFPDTIFCEGGSVTLTAGDGYRGYLWSTWDTTQSITVTKSGTYTVSVLNALGCVGTSQSITITVVPTPDPVITGVLALCNGDSTTLDAGAGYASYSWSNGTRTRFSTVTKPGTYFVIVADSLGCTGTSEEVTVTFNRAPTVDAGTDVTICPGGSTMLTGSGGAFYHWIPSLGLDCADCQSPIAHPDTTTTYTLTVTDSLGCSANDSVTVHVRPLRTLAHDDTMDAGSILVQTSLDTFFIVTNTGADSVTVASVSLNDSSVFSLIYSVRTGGFSLAPGESKKIYVRYSPVQARRDSAIATLTIADTCGAFVYTHIYGIAIGASPEVTEICGNTPTPVVVTSPVVYNINLMNDITVPVDSVTFNIAYDPSALAPREITSPAGTATMQRAAPNAMRVRLSSIGNVIGALKAGGFCTITFSTFETTSDTIQTVLQTDSIAFYPAGKVIASGCAVTATVLPICGLHGVHLVGVTSLQQNYPNPFTGKTTFTLSLAPADAGHARLKIYNLLGEEVADLTAQANGGASNIEFDGRALSPGAYVCKLQTPSVNITRQIFVMR